MASIAHVAVGMAAGRWAGERRGASSAFVGMLFLSMLGLLPDLDVISFRYGIAYGDAYGHRGALHSLAVALVVGVALGAVVPLGRLAMTARMIVCCAVLASHGLLDTLTDGGLGVALLWPVSNHRFFAPIRPIPVAPIGLGLLTRRGATVLVTELEFCLPLFAYAFFARRSSRTS